MKLVLASDNKNKLREFRTLFENFGVELISKAESGFTEEVEETGETFAENARIKAEAVLAAGRRKDRPLARSLGGKYVAVRESTAERADKPRRAVVSPAEIPKQEVIAVGVGIVMISGIARGMHARRAAERVHAEASHEFHEWNLT